MSLVLLVLSYQTGTIRSEQGELRLAAEQLAEGVSEIETEFESQFPDSSLARMIREGVIWNRIATFSTYPYELLIYRGDSLLLWTQNLLVPSQPIATFPAGMSFQKFSNGYFLVYQKLVNVETDSIRFSALAFIPVKYEYQTSNSYLKPHFSSRFKIPNYFQLSENNEENYVPVKDGGGHELFYLGIDPADYSGRASALALILFLAAIISFVLFINRLLNLLPDNRLVWLRPLILAALFFLVYLVMSNKSILPGGVKNWKIFDADLFASEGVASSLGSLAIQLLFLFWACIYITNKVHIRIRMEQTSMLNYVVHVLGYFSIFFLSIYTVDVIRALVRDSKIEFVFFNPLQPDYYSILGVVCIALIFICLFLLSLKIIATLQRKPLKPLDNGIVLLICTTLAFMYYLAYDTGISGLWVMIWINTLIQLLPFFSIRTQGGVNFARLFLMLVFVSASGAALLLVYGEKKEQDTRINFARKLINTEDKVTEFLLADLQGKITRDPFVLQFFQSEIDSGPELTERLQQLYFQEGFSRYRIRYFPVDVKGYLLAGRDEYFGFVTEKGLKALKSEIIKDELYHSSAPSGSFSYLAEYAIQAGDSLLGKLYVELTADAYKNAGVYPELLLEDKDKLPFESMGNSFAVYNHQHLVEQNGEYFYDYHLKWTPDENREYRYVTYHGFNHLVYNRGNGIVIVVSGKTNWFPYFTSYFSFLFVVFFNITLLVLLFNVITINPGFRSIRQLFRRASLRMLIHGFFMLFILALLLIIAYVAGWFFIRQFNDLSIRTVVEKMNRVTEAVQVMYNQNAADKRAESFTGMLKKNINSFAEVQDIDINFFDLQGNLVATSQRSFFEKGLVSRKINPVAYKELSDEGPIVLVKEEQVGTLKFYSGYRIIRDPDGVPVLFIHVPYFNSRANLNEQVGFFFVALVNILVLAIIMAGLLAPLISQQITRKLSVIGEKFKQVKIGSGNELIEWHANDEIGNLVNEYNKMIGQLEQSAEKLAESERDLAWREMAKQVAHEIKNPLTPMKLGIQHLQRAYEQNAPNLPELTAKVSRTLIEQIDNLSHIANEFSNYAKMPRPVFENIDVNDVVQTACNLIREGEGAEIHLHDHAERSTVSADKNQLLSVFNNLLLNAVQSIPEDRGGNVNVITENVDGMIVISVSDNGVGISEDQAKNVFIPSFTT
ncbi:MAG TPA: histidine kinase dimerization/phospho-acceptor domain-containing protein, partial [Chitinophagales bacterium]|nr:histidine kinase dimerization/phospho-acceptor domain-containing protein [Chitinophagales bacterium]